MLRATEQLTWLANLEKFARGLPTNPNEERFSEGIKCDTSNAQRGRDEVAWQHFSGKHLRCRVVFTQPSEKSLSSQALSSGSEQPVSRTATSGKRQLRIIIECGSSQMEQDEVVEVQGAERSAQDLDGCLDMKSSLRSQGRAKPPIILVRSI